MVKIRFKGYMVIEIVKAYFYIIYHISRSFRHIKNSCTEIKRKVRSNGKTINRNIAFSVPIVYRSTLNRPCYR